MHGDLDPRVTREQNAVIYERLAGPKKLSSFPGAGHESLIVDAPEAWKRYVTDFLQEHLVSK